MKIPLPIEPWIRKDMTKKCLFFPLIVFVFHTQREVPDVDDALKFYFTDKLMEIRKLYALTTMTFPRCPSDTQFVFMSWIESCRVTFGLGCDAMHSLERLHSSAAQPSTSTALSNDKMFNMEWREMFLLIKTLLWLCTISTTKHMTWFDPSVPPTSYYIFRYIEKRYVSQLQPHSLRWVPTYMVLNNNILIFWRIRDRSPSWIIISCRTRSGQWDKLSFIWECEWIVILFFPIKTLLLILILRLHPVRIYVCIYLLCFYEKRKLKRVSWLQKRNFSYNNLL